jgi:hypothetical protein
MRGAPRLYIEGCFREAPGCARDRSFAIPRVADESIEMAPQRSIVDEIVGILALAGRHARCTQALGELRCVLFCVRRPIALSMSRRCAWRPARGSY